MIALIFCSAVLTSRRPAKHPLYSALPGSAVIVNQAMQTYGPLEIYYLQASMDASDFSLYVQALQLEAYKPGAGSAFTTWRRGDQDPKWFQPPLAIEGTFMRETEENWIVAKHDGQYIWAFAFKK